MYMSKDNNKKVFTKRRRILLVKEELQLVL